MRGIVLTAAAWAALGSAGCTVIGPTWGSAVGATAFSYQAGKASQGFGSSGAQVQAAALEAMADLGIHSVRQSEHLSHDPAEPARLGVSPSTQSLVTFDGRTVDGRHATITVTSRVAGPDATRPEIARPVIVTARFGWIGDEALAKALMDRIGIRLGTLPPSAIPAEPPSDASITSLFSGGDKKPAAGMIRGQADAGYRDTPVP